MQANAVINAVIREQERERERERETERVNTCACASLNSVQQQSLLIANL